MTNCPKQGVVRAAYDAEYGDDLGPVPVLAGDAYLFWNEIASWVQYEIEASKTRRSESDYIRHKYAGDTDRALAQQLRLRRMVADLFSRLHEKGTPRHD